MTAGFQSINTGGTVQIDANYKNYILASSGTLTLDTSIGNRIRGMSNVSLVVTGTAPVVAFDRLRVFIHKITKSGSTWTYVFLGLSSPSLPDPATFNYYVFDVGYAAAPGTNCGLLLYDATGALVFDSNQLGFPAIAGTASRLGNATATTTTFAAGRTIAIVQAQAGYQIAARSGGGLEYWVTLAEANANSVTLHPRLLGTGTNASVDSDYSAFYTNVPSKYLFVDITDIL